MCVSLFAWWRMRSHQCCCIDSESCGSSWSTCSGGRTKRRRPVPPLKQVSVLRSGRQQNLCRMGQGKTLRVDVSRIIPKNLLPIVRKLFSFFFSFFVFFCLHHPVVVVHEIVLYSFVCFSWLYEFIDVVLPPSFGSSYQSSCFDFVVTPRMPIKMFSGPSFFW